MRTIEEIRRKFNNGEELHRADTGRLLELLDASPTEAGAKRAAERIEDADSELRHTSREKARKIIAAIITEEMGATQPETDDQPCPDPRCNDQLGAMPIPQCVTAVAWAEMADKMPDAMEHIAELRRDIEKADAVNKSLRARVLELEEMGATDTGQWRDIASAPKDGSAILISCGRQVQLVRWMVSAAKGAEDGWWFVGGYDGHLLGFAPKYWMPLPSAPGVAQPSAVRCCPLCRQPLEVMPNGRAWCVNTAKGAASAEEWEAKSCLLAQNSVIMPIEIWDALATTTVPATPSGEAQEIADAIFRGHQQRAARHPLNSHSYEEFTARAIGAKDVLYALRQAAIPSPAASEPVAVEVNCNVCGGTGDVVIGCAMTQALTTTCSKCRGTGKAAALPAAVGEQNDEGK